MDAAKSGAMEGINLPADVRKELAAVEERIRQRLPLSGHVSRKALNDELVRFAFAWKYWGDFCFAFAAWGCRSLLRGIALLRRRGAADPRFPCAPPLTLSLFRGGATSARGPSTAR